MVVCHIFAYIQAWFFLFFVPAISYMMHLCVRVCFCRFTRKRLVTLAEKFVFVTAFHCQHPLSIF